MKKLLVTGASGSLGWEILHYNQKTWEIHGTYCCYDNITQPNMWRVDLTSDAGTALFSAIKPDAVVHMAALTNTGLCEQQPQKSKQINVDVSSTLAQLCKKHNIPFLFTSTDLVFDGNKSFSRETDRVAPLNIYGTHKVMAENAIQKIYPEAIICRLPIMLGHAPRPGNFIQESVYKLKQKQEISLFTDEFRTPTGTRSVAKGIFFMLDKLPKGIFHLGGKERVSRYEMGIKMCKILDLDTKLIVPIEQQSIVFSCPRPKDVSLNSEKAYCLGYSPYNLNDEIDYTLKKIFSQVHF